jgi:predicted nicotinamide N-methyase
MPGLAELLRQRSSEQINILELGAGCGIVGIALAQCHPNCAVELTDQADAQDLLARNLGQATAAGNPSLAARILEWDAESQGPSLEHDLTLIVVSDCTYNADSCPDLVRTISRLTSTSPGVRVLVAMKRRHDSEEIFFDLMGDANLQILEKAIIQLPLEDSDFYSRPPEIELYLFGLFKDS